MKFEILMKIMDCGDKHGSAFKDILAYYGIEDNDLSHIDDEMATKWLSRQKCKCWQKGHWFLETYDTCTGTREKEPCSCKGDRNKCDFYGKDDKR